MQFSAPLADELTVYVASSADRQSGGSFVSQNIVEQDPLTTDVIQEGSWTDITQLDPGTYYVMLNAVPDYNYCYEPAQGTYDPSCASGFSSVVALTVPVPTIRYKARATLVRGAKRVRLRLTATPLGSAERYHVCYLNHHGRKTCRSGTIRGFFWDTPGSAQLTVSTGQLRGKTTFTWYLGSRAVAKRRISTSARRH